MNESKHRMARSDALVLFGVTGDLAHEMIFPALYALARRGAFAVPVIGVASSKWSLAQLRKRAEDGIRTAGKIDDRRALRRLLSLLRYVDGDYNDPITFSMLKQALGAARCRRQPRGSADPLQRHGAAPPRRVRRGLASGLHRCEPGARGQRSIAAIPAGRLR
jgi:glucose-6-phosphate 1-dehydrogenase